MARFALISLLVIAIATAALADSCSRYNSCGTCTAVPDCGWCKESNECISGPTTCRDVRVLPVRRPEQCNAAPACVVHSSCMSCLTQPGCGWCSNTKQCDSATPAGAPAKYCPASQWSTSKCTKAANPMVPLIIAGIGIAGTAVLLGALFFWHRRSRYAVDDEIEAELRARGDDDTSFYSDTPSFSTSSPLPGYMYTTSTSGDSNQPQYVYTAVPVGPVLATIPQ